MSEKEDNAAVVAKKRGCLVRSDIAAVVSKTAGLSKTKANEVLENILNAISSAVKNGDSVRLKRFGSFVLHKSPPRKGRNPKTGDPVMISTRHSMKFRASIDLRDIPG